MEGVEAALRDGDARRPRLAGGATHLLRRLRHPIAAHVGVLASAQVVGMGLSLATTIVSARLMGPRAYGVAALLIAFPSLLWSVVGVKSMAVTTRYIARLRAEG